MQTSSSSTATKWFKGAKCADRPNATEVAQIHTLAQTAKTILEQLNYSTIALKLPK